mmetsp:Transcript_8605/g.13267  ORF Transcript_8605/g.13267 Transcript_8605/m.13267 type:complete len:251 (-) Transcript_8605:770-1522(-)
MMSSRKSPYRLLFLFLCVLTRNFVEAYLLNFKRIEEKGRNEQKVVDPNQKRRRHWRGKPIRERRGEILNLLALENNFARGNLLEGLLIAVATTTTMTVSLPCEASVHTDTVTIVSRIQTRSNDQEKPISATHANSFHRQHLIASALSTSKAFQNLPPEPMIPSQFQSKKSKALKQVRELQDFQDDRLAQCTDRGVFWEQCFMFGERSQARLSRNREEEQWKNAIDYQYISPLGALNPADGRNQGKMPPTW